jgi:XRE family transcriptional regulator, fatty acid utilization regulator
VCAVAKMFSGARLRRLRNERGLTQAALAQALGLSTSYVNQLENDQRPITVPVLIALTERFDLLPQYFSSDTDARLVADLSDLFTETGANKGSPAPRLKSLLLGCPRSAAVWSRCTAVCATPLKS